MDFDFSPIIGKGLGPRHMEYTWRDCALYALGVGAAREDLPYIFERNPGGMKILPTFALLPYINNINMYPLCHVPNGPNELFSDFMVRKIGYLPNRLHMAMELIVHTPLHETQGTFLTEDCLNCVYDRGEGKGVVADCQMDVYDRAGTLLSTLHSYHYHAACGGFGGPKFDSRKLDYPDRAPDETITEFMPENIAVLYRLSGDTYDVHIDPAAAGKFGYEKPFNQGLCTYGFAARMLLQRFIPYQPERVRHIYAQMRSVCFPGQNVTVQAWQLAPGSIAFKLLDENGKVLLGNGLFEYE